MSGESDLNLISPKTPVRQYEPIERKKGKGRQQKTTNLRTAYTYASLAYTNTKALALLLKLSSPIPSNTCNV